MLSTDILFSVHDVVRGGLVFIRSCMPTTAVAAVHSRQVAIEDTHLYGKECIISESISLTVDAKDCQQDIRGCSTEHDVVLGQLGTEVS